MGKRKTENHRSRRKPVGYSISAAAREIGVSRRKLQDAVDLQQVRIVAFGKLPLVPRGEVERIRAEFAQGAK